MNHLGHLAHLSLHEFIPNHLVSEYNFIRPSSESYLAEPLHFEGNSQNSHFGACLGGFPALPKLYLQGALEFHIFIVSFSSYSYHSSSFPLTPFSPVLIIFHCPSDLSAFNLLCTHLKGCLSNFLTTQFSSFSFKFIVLPIVGTNYCNFISQYHSDLILKFSPCP